MRAPDTATPPPRVPHKARAATFARPDAVERLAGLPYQREILAAAAIAGIDPLLLASVIHVESSFRAQAVSRAGAVGLMQLLPRTARQYGEWNLRDPGDNIHAGSLHLSRLLRRFEGNVSLALAAYNAGESNVIRHGGVPPFPETRRYVRRVIHRYTQMTG